MKVFFIGERRYKDNTEINNKIIKHLEKSGYKVDKSFIESEHDSDFSNFEEAYKRNIHSIKNCDFVVAEVTSTSSGLGYLVATALSHKKPVLTFFDKTSKITQSQTLKGVSNKLFIYNKYDQDSLIKDLDKALGQTKQLLDTKFILIIPAEIDRYLEWASDYKRMHKAQIVRQAIEEYMERDEDWKEFLNED
ncbi:hypothetical protein GF389_06135 [Candidatus Dojkabacteria bacterium]|nr:hypothetical protein [Candidatus Dojkabacteria bacterium]